MVPQRISMVPDATRAPIIRSSATSGSRSDEGKREGAAPAFSGQIMKRTALQGCVQGSSGCRTLRDNRVHAYERKMHTRGRLRHLRRIEAARHSARPHRTGRGSGYRLLGAGASHSSGDFEPAEIRLFGALIPHLQRAVQLRRRLTGLDGPPWGSKNKNRGPALEWPVRLVK